MAGKGDGEGEGNVLKLENQILIIKYVILFTNIIEWVSEKSLFSFPVPLVTRSVCLSANVETTFRKPFVEIRPTIAFPNFEIDVIYDERIRYVALLTVRAFAQFFE